MSRSPIFLIIIVAIILTSSIVLAQGAINVKMTKLDKTLPYPIILGLGLAALIFAGIIYMIISKPRIQHQEVRPVSRPEKIVENKQTVSMKQQIEPVKGREYYRSVFEKKDNTKIVDEIPEPLPKKKVKVQKPETQKPEVKIEKYLKEDERIVLNVLKMKNNSCSQATIQVVTDFSKAHLSRIVAELTERGIVFKERRGRKNIITLNA